MRTRTKQLLLLLLLIGIVTAVHLSGLSGYLTFASLAEHRGLLEQTVARHYVLSVLLYLLLYILTALAVPGALILTAAGAFSSIPSPASCTRLLVRQREGYLHFFRVSLGDALQEFTFIVRPKTEKLKGVPKVPPKTEKLKGVPQNCRVSPRSIPQQAAGLWG